MKVPRGHVTSSRVPAGQYFPRAQGRPGPHEPAQQTYIYKYTYTNLLIFISRSFFEYVCGYLQLHISSDTWRKTEVSVLQRRLTCRTEASFSTSLAGCPTCLTQLFPCRTSRARWPMRNGSALFTVISQWAQELGGRPQWAAFQTEKP